MPVFEAVDETVIEIDNVYVIRPNSSMTVAQGRLTLPPRTASLRSPMPVDDLRASMAKDQKPADLREITENLRKGKLGSGPDVTRRERTEAPASGAHFHGILRICSG